MRFSQTKLGDGHWDGTYISLSCCLLYCIACLNAVDTWDVELHILYDLGLSFNTGFIWFTF